MNKFWAGTIVGFLVAVAMHSAGVLLTIGEAIK